MITDVLAYFRARMKEVQPRRKEWTDGFNWQNIPETLLGSSFAFQVDPIVSVGTHHQDNFHIAVPITLRIFFFDDRKPRDLKDTAITVADAVLQDFTAGANRTSFRTVKNVSFNIMSVDPLAESNDNGVILRMQFTALVIVPTR